LSISDKYELQLQLLKRIKVPRMAESSRFVWGLYYTLLLVTLRKCNHGHNYAS